MKKPFVCDRTPLDMIGYMLGEVTMHSCDLELSQRIERYVERCLWIVQHTYFGVIVCRPLPFYEAAEDKPPESPAYQTMIQLLIEGASDRIDTIDIATLQTSDHEERMGNSIDYINQLITQLNKERMVNKLYIN